VATAIANRPRTYVAVGTQRLLHIIKSATCHGMLGTRKMIRAFLFLLVAVPGVAPAQSLDDLEKIDVAIRAAPEYPGRDNPLRITKKAELKTWANPTGYEEKEDIMPGVKSFIVRWPEATASGFFPLSHCCTEVFFGELVTTAKEWTFFGKIKVGDKEDHVLSTLAPTAVRENDKIKYCGLNECAVFTIKKGRVSKVALLLYTD